jgi:hypothetical protein
MSYKGMWRHWFHGVKANEAVNAIPTNVDVNRHFLTRAFSNDAFGGQAHMEEAMRAVRNYRTRGGRTIPYEEDIAKKQKLLREETDPEARKHLQESLAEDRRELARLKERQEGDPTFWETTRAVADHTWRAMNEGTAAQVATKWGVVAGTYMTLNAMGRAATGGGVTYNAAGQRDIMGIPFI